MIDIKGGELVLLPTKLGDQASLDSFLPKSNLELIKGIRVFIVENLRSARRFISSLKLGIVIDDLVFLELGKTISDQEILDFLLDQQGNKIGLLSEAGVPAVADPGSQVVLLAHQLSFSVKPLVGPSSILLALMASGLNGQSFTFHGYLPIQKKERSVKIRQLESLAKKNNQTQIFIETPYRNDQMFAALLNDCQSHTLLCIASNILEPDELIKTQTIQQWKKHKVEIHKKPTIFLIL